MKQEPEFFEGKEAVLVFIAKRLRDALRLEEALTAAGIDFGVETDEYRGGVLFGSVRTGAFFYVLPDSADSARHTIAQTGFKPHVE
jgi:hypothetical protein